MLRRAIPLLCLAALLALVLAGPGRAGAWPRGKGQLFVTTSGYMTWSGGPQPTGFAAIYAEWGLSDRVTLGLDLGRGVSGASKTVAFASIPVGKMDGKLRMAVELGLGEIAGKTILRPGLSYGMGFNSKLGSGWVALDTVAEMGLETGVLDLKTDLTIGLQPGKRVKTMVQFQAGIQQNDPAFLRVVPSVVWEWREGTSLEIGITKGLIGPDETGLKISLWRSF